MPSGGVVVVPAVAFGGYVDYQVDVETGTAGDDGLGVLGYLAVEGLGSIPVLQDGRLVLAEGDALAAAYALVVVDNGGYVLAGVVDSLYLLEVDGVMGAVFHADTAAAAVLDLDDGLR